jgi:ketosteroid isomerase-like protein
MSRENVEIVRRLYEALRKFELAGNRAALELLDPDVEWHGTIGGLGEGTVARGRDEVSRFIAEDSQEWDELSFEPKEFIDVGDTVVVLQHERRRGRLSGVEVEEDTAAVLSLRNGRVWRCQPYMSQAEALAAAGLGDRPR